MNNICEKARCYAYPECFSTLLFSQGGFCFLHVGYITNVKKNGTTIATYSYDGLGQLVGETVNNQIYIFSYDKSGNITQKHVYTGDIGNLTDTIIYTYSTSAWGDLLTNYDGTNISYDSIGNPTNWRNSSSLTWDGRTLISQELSNDNSITYKYNSDGIRTQKRVFDDVASAYIIHDYVLDGSKILSETVTDNAYYNSYTLYYIYDASGSITGLHYNNQPYYFQKNIQGDILRILDRTGTAVVEYTYDAWGNILSVTGSMASTLGQYNPFRYRGYYYDSETDLYYLNSRYYDAEVGRFINADSYVSTGQGILGFNMFAYCNNNPVNLVDQSGNNATTVQWWTSTMWWLCGADTALPVGDIIYVAGIVILGIYALTVVDDVTVPQISWEEEKEDIEPELPDVTYPGDDPTKAPEGTEWKGKGEQGGKQGNYHNPETGESWHPDLNHPKPIGPHWDYRDPTGKWWRVGPGNVITPK